MHNRLHRLTASIAILTLSLLAGCSTKSADQPSAPAAQVKKGGSFTYAYNSDPTSLDPQKTPSTTTVHDLIYDTLFIRTPDRDYAPNLVDTYSLSDDGKVLDMKLKQGIKFHDGEPFNAESVKFTFDRAVDKDTKSPQSGGMLAGYEKTEIVGEYEVKVYFTAPQATIFYNLSQTFLAPLPPKAVKDKGDNFGREPVGTGPYKFVKWQANDSIVLEKNPDWKLAPKWADNKGPMYFDQIVFKYIPDENTQVMALQNGEIDILGVPGQQLDAVKKNPDYNFVESTAANLVYLGINSKKAPFNDERVRQAIASTIDRDEIVKNALFDQGVANWTLLSPAIWGYDPGLKDKAWPLDLAKGAQLLTEAGFKKNASGKWEKDGKVLTFEIMTYTTQPYPRVAEVVQSQIAKLGIDVKIKTLDSATLLAATPKGEHDAILIAYGWSDPDILFNFLHSSRLASSNRVLYVDKDLDALLEKGRTTVDLKARFAVYQEAQARILQKAPWVPLYTGKGVTAIRKDIKGIKTGPNGELYLYDAYKDVK